MLQRLFLFLFLTGSCLTVFSGSIDDCLKSINAADYPGANLVVVFDLETGLTYVNIHRLYKVFTPAGALQLSVIKFDYDPLSAYVDIEKVVVHRQGDGGTSQVTSRVLDYPAPARAIYWGAREKMIEVGRLEPGDAVEVWLFRKGFTYALLNDEQGDDDRYIPPMRGHFYDIVTFYSDDPIIEKVYRASIPADKVLQYEFYNGEVKSSAVRQGDLMI
jgi:hypothetical protein